MLKQVKIGNVELKLPHLDLLPRLTAEQFAALKADVVERGVIVPIVTDEHNAVIDGAHRSMAAEVAGLTSVSLDIRKGLSEAEKVRLALDLNLKRRQITSEQLRQLAVDLRLRGISYRMIGSALGVSHEKARKDVAASVNTLTVGLPNKIKGKDGRLRPAMALPTAVKSATKPPIAYYGGKQLLSRYFLPFIPPHQHYAEIFGGSGALMFRKDPSPIETFNEVDGWLTNLYKVIRENRRELAARLELTPYSELEYQQCLEKYKSGESIPDPVE